MASTVDIVIVIVFIIIIVAIVIYAFVAYRDGSWPFHPYVQPPPTSNSADSFQPVDPATVVPLTQDEQICRQKTVCTPPFPNSGGNGDQGTAPPFCQQEPFKSSLAAPCPADCLACNGQSATTTST